jgi:hypothetical protein
VHKFVYVDGNWECDLNCYSSYFDINELSEEVGLLKVAVWHEDVAERLLVQFGQAPFGDTHKQISYKENLEAKAKSHKQMADLIRKVNG